MSGAIPKPAVTVAVATQETIPNIIDAIGTAQPFRTVQLKSMVAGQISRVLLKQGEYVHAGQLLFQIDKRPFQAALDQAKAKLAEDKATAAYDRVQANRDQVMAKEGIIAPQALQQQQAQAQSAVATVQADRAALEAAQVNLGYTDIRAPISGRAGAILVNLGNLVQANSSSPLTVLNQVTPIYVQFNIPEADLPSVRAKGIGRLNVDAFPSNQEKPATGKLTFINNTVDSATGTVQLMATMPNTGRRLWPGEFLNIRLGIGVDKQATVVPATAVQNGPQGKYVYVVRPGGTAVMTTVNSPRNYRQLAVIASGVKPGDQVIVAGQIKVAPGSKVQVVRTVPVTPAPGQMASTAETGEASGSAQ